MHVIASTTAAWYAARAGGVVAYLLISASVLAGILLAGKARVPGLPRFAVEDVHRFLGLLAGLFVVIHVCSISLDTVVPFSLVQLVVPFAAAYRPLATGLGIVALEVLLAVSVTNRLRTRIPYRLWRRVHYATLAVWLLATVHGVLAGTDRDQAWLQLVYALTVALVAGAAALRLARSTPQRRLLVALGAAAGAAAAVLALAALPQQVAPSKQRTEAVPAIPEIHGGLKGTIEQSGSGILSIRGTAGSGSAFRIDLLTPDGREVADSAIQVRFPGGATCEGTLTALDESGFTGTCSLPDGGTRTVSSSWTVSGGTVAGTISTANAAPA